MHLEAEYFQELELGHSIVCGSLNLHYSIVYTKQKIKATYILIYYLNQRKKKYILKLK